MDQVPMPACVASVEGLAGVSDRELLARLVFAEGMSTGVGRVKECREADVFSRIAQGVLSRVALAPKFGRGVRGVIFRKGQFNPAVSKRSRFSRAFLCPTEWPGYVQYWSFALGAAAAGPEARFSGVTHFYYPKSEQATARPPGWADVRGKAYAPELSDACVWFFRQ